MRPEFERGSSTHWKTHRTRRWRHSKGLRSMLRQVHLRSTDLICPIFVTHGEGIRSEIPSMPGQFQISVDQLNLELEAIQSAEIPAVILFGIPEVKDSQGSGAFAEDGIIQRAVRAIKAKAPELVVITDVCLCEYTDHGHCGVTHAAQSGHTKPSLPDGYVLNDDTLPLLQKIALSHARSGADIVAPSGMIDGMVATIREALDCEHFEHVAIMAYSVKYSSAFYGPFRDAADGAPQFGDRKTHQMDFAESRQGLREAQLDVDQGADFLMVKPALAYLDMVSQLHHAFPELPLVAYNVSGEYSMIKAAAQNGWLDEQETVLEMLTGMKRAGADLIITYHAKDVGTWLKQTK